MSLNPDFYTVNNSCIAPLVAASFLSLYLIVQKQNQNYLYSKYSQIILNLLYKMVTLMYCLIRIKLGNIYFQEFSCLLNSNKYQNNVFMLWWSRVIIPSSQRRVYHFIRQTMQHWPLDSSFKQIHEIWLSYIQPWRYLDYRTRCVSNQQLLQRFRVYVLIVSILVVLWFSLSI